jgi:hypothetical protein
MLSAFSPIIAGKRMASESIGCSRIDGDRERAISAAVAGTWGEYGAPTYVTPKFAGHTAGLK